MNLVGVQGFSHPGSVILITNSGFFTYQLLKRSTRILQTQLLLQSPEIQESVF
jgi:hypothetical protein